MSTPISVLLKKDIAISFQQILNSCETIGDLRELERQVRELKHDKRK